MTTVGEALSVREQHLLLGLYGVPCQHTEIEFDRKGELMFCFNRGPGLPSVGHLQPNVAAYYLHGQVTGGVLVTPDVALPLGRLQGFDPAQPHLAERLLLQQRLAQVQPIGDLLQRTLLRPPRFRSPLPLASAYINRLRLLFGSGHPEVRLHAQFTRRVLGSRWRVWAESRSQPLGLQVEGVTNALAEAGSHWDEVRHPLTEQRFDAASLLDTPQGHGAVMAHLLSRRPYEALHHHLDARAAISLHPHKTHLTLWVGRL